MIYKTQYFGEIDCDESELFRFPAGLPGFESETAFLLIPFAESGGTMFSLQSAVTSSLSFLVMDPFDLLPDYAPELTAADLQSLGTKEQGELSFCVLCACKDPIAESTVNLRCPIALHLDAKLGKQIIMDTERYGMHHRLAEFSHREEHDPC